MGQWKLWKQWFLTGMLAFGGTFNRVHRQFSCHSLRAMEVEFLATTKFKPRILVNSYNAKGSPPHRTMWDTESSS